MKDLKEAAKKASANLGKKSASKPTMRKEAGQETKLEEDLAMVKISSLGARKEKLLARKNTKPQESNVTLTKGSLMGSPGGRGEQGLTKEEVH